MNKKAFYAIAWNDIVTGGHLGRSYARLSIARRQLKWARKTQATAYLVKMSYDVTGVLQTETLTNE